MNKRSVGLGGLPVFQGFFFGFISKPVLFGLAFMKTEKWSLHNTDFLLSPETQS